MPPTQTIEDFRTFIMEHGLPDTEIALFGVKCPYCGKSDRIKKLDPPGDLGQVLDEEALTVYEAFFQEMGDPDTSMGVCGFCRNCLTLKGGGRAEPL